MNYETIFGLTVLILASWGLVEILWKIPFVKKVMNPIKISFERNDDNQKPYSGASYMDSISNYDEMIAQIEILNLKLKTCQANQAFPFTSIMALNEIMDRIIKLESESKS